MANFFSHGGSPRIDNHKKSCRAFGGFSVFLSWCYCSFFSCGLLTSFIVLCFIERVWMIAGAAQAATVLLVLFVSRRFHPLESRHAMVTATLASMAGSLCVYNCSPALGEWLGIVVVAGGVLLGFGKGVLSLVWGRVACTLDEENVEFAVPLSFALACAAYFLLIAFKQPAFIVIDLLLPPLSLAMLLFGGKAPQRFFADARKGAHRAVSGPLLQPKSSYQPLKGASNGLGKTAGMRALLPLAAVLLLLWSQFAFLRVVTSPTTLTNRFFHYVIPFSCALVFAVGLFTMYARHGRRLSFSLVFRLALPLLVVSYALLIADFENATVRIVAHAINFMAMFCASIVCWVVAPKYVHYGGVSFGALFGTLFAAEGLGTAIGAAFGLLLFDQGVNGWYLGAALAVLAILLAASPLAGADSRWSSSHRAFPLEPLPRKRGTYGSDICNNAGRSEAAGSCDGSGKLTTKAIADSSGEISGRVTSDVSDASAISPPDKGSELAVLFEKAALRLRERYGLTRRETEIATLLLAGRSRPYIRDELTVSLSTVHSHVSNIYAKCGVHSQQDFMDLLEKGTGA